MFELTIDPSQFKWLSDVAIKNHHSKHCKVYADNLTELIDGTSLSAKHLEQIVTDQTIETNSAIFRNAAQLLNHQMFFDSITSSKTSPSDKLKYALCKQFGSVDEFDVKFVDVCKQVFGSGWVWVAVQKGQISIVRTSGALTPVRDGYDVLTVCDLWEHSYIYDDRYIANRPDYVSQFIEHINWEHASVVYERHITKQA